MSDRKKLGMCNYCQSLGPVYEQEDLRGNPTFLVCHNCITDVIVGIEMAEDKTRRPIRRKTNSENWEILQQWLDGYRNNPGA
jgi:hypothetical protein